MFGDEISANGVTLNVVWVNVRQRGISDPPRLAISSDSRHALSRSWSEHRRLVAATRKTPSGNTGSLSPGRDLGLDFRLLLRRAQPLRRWQ
jgi:hypothetical protein